MYLWRWYRSISDGLKRIHDGVCCPIPPSEFVAWTVCTETIILPSEYAILRDMDLTFCEETNKELQAYRERMQEKGKK